VRKSSFLALSGFMIMTKFLDAQSASIVEIFLLAMGIAVNTAAIPAPQTSSASIM
jgi:hypothetical protein